MWAKATICSEGAMAGEECRVAIMQILQIATSLFKCSMDGIVSNSNIILILHYSARYSHSILGDVPMIDEY